MYGSALRDQYCSPEWDLNLGPKGQSLLEFEAWQLIPVGHQGRYDTNKSCNPVNFSPSHDNSSISISSLMAPSFLIVVSSNFRPAPDESPRVAAIGWGIGAVQPELAPGPEPSS